MRYYEIVHRPEHTNCDQSNCAGRETLATQGNLAKRSDFYGCLATLPKPSHILLVRPVTMRPFLFLVAIGCVR